MIGELLRWDPFGSEYDAAAVWRQRGGGFAPSVDLRESAQAYIFQVDLPGVKEDDIEISVTGNRLTISGQREEERREDDERFHAYECSYGSFSRSFTLPEGTDPDNVQAEMKGGVLRVTVPKRPEVQPRRIDIGQRKAGDGGKTPPAPKS